MRPLALAALLAASSGALAQVSVQEYALPPRITAHDVWADPAPGGPVWFSGQSSGNAGRLDPKTGKVELIPLGDGSAPHGVILDRDGSAWFTDGGQNAIVRVDPKTREVKKWPLPKGSGYANLNTAAFDKAGVHWFTGQSGIYGR
ncbi:MAG TPA: lyase, partial [Burkholderiales bacterium]|nr:lyase [Burkholderiales bacterium]